MRAIAVAALCCILAGGCTSPRPYQPMSYVVRPNDTLYGIAWRHGLDYRDLARWNNIGRDYRLSIGEVLLLQATGNAGAVRAATAAAVPPSSAAPPPQAPAAPRAGKPTAAVPPPPFEPDAYPASVAGSRWVWPTERLSAPKPVPGGGILLLGKLGQDVRAAGSGRVVYTGNGIRGYGNLIIIKHGDSLLSSYAHNREMLVHEGEDVAAGQVIAHMGTGPHQICALYFEIRVNGKPTDPLRYLAAGGERAEGDGAVTP